MSEKEIERREDYVKSTLQKYDKNSNPERLRSYLNWIKKQAEQRQKTIDLKGVSHSPIRMEQFLIEKKIYEEEAKRLEKLLKKSEKK